MKTKWIRIIFVIITVKIQGIRIVRYALYGIYMGSSSILGSGSEYNLCLLFAGPSVSTRNSSHMLSTSLCPL